jgi:hypothetical protein
MDTWFSLSIANASFFWYGGLKSYVLHGSLAGELCQYAMYVPTIGFSLMYPQEFNGIQENSSIPPHMPAIGQSVA